MKQGFTLIEVLVVLIIMAVLVGTAVLSVGAGMKSARLRDAARVVTFYTRHAKAIALLKQKPVVVTFEEIVDGGEFAKSRVSVTYSPDAEDTSVVGVGQGGGTDGQARTLSGVLVADLVEGDAAPPSAPDDGSGDPDALEVEPKEFEGIHIVAEARDEQQERRPRISVFSNVDTLRRQSANAREQAKTSAREKSGLSADADSSSGEAEEGEQVDEESSFSAVYEANGRCEPYRITIWKEGEEKEEGIVINIGRFGRPVTEP